MHATSRPASDVSTTLHGHVATVEITRPPNNFFDVALISDIADTCEELAAGNHCRAIVLCSEGRHFCAGANFASGDPLGGRTGPHLYDVGVRIFEQPLPI